LTNPLQAADHSYLFFVIQALQLLWRRRLRVIRAMRGSVGRRQNFFCFLLDSARHDFVRLDPIQLT